MPEVDTPDQHRGDRGFSLVELLVVIVILGILAAIAAPSYLGHRDRAAEASEKADARSLAAQLETYYVDAQRYPAAGELSWLPGPRAIQFGTTGENVRLSPHNQARVLRGEGDDVYCVEVRNTRTGTTAVLESGSGPRESGPGAACPADYAATVLAYPAG